MDSNKIKILTKPYFVSCLTDCYLQGYDRRGVDVRPKFTSGEVLIAFKGMTNLGETLILIDSQYNLFINPLSTQAAKSIFVIKQPIYSTKQEVIETVNNKKYILF